MSALAKYHYLTSAEYLLGENDRLDGIRYEYINGQTYAMAGASRNHNRVALGIASRLEQHLRGQPCDVFIADMKVGILTADEERFYYPDVQVTCSEETAKYYNTAPKLIVEVLSDSTARTDRTEKLYAYRLLPSLQEYLLCSQDSPLLEIYRRRTAWQIERYVAGQVCVLESVDLVLQVDELYSFLLNEPQTEQPV